MSDKFTSAPELCAEGEATTARALASYSYPKQFIVNTETNAIGERLLKKCNFNQGVICTPYVKGISESISQVFLPLNMCYPGLKDAFLQIPGAALFTGYNVKIVAPFTSGKWVTNTVPVSKSTNVT